MLTSAIRTCREVESLVNFWLLESLQQGASYISRKRVWNVRNKGTEYEDYTEQEPFLISSEISEILVHATKM